MKKLILTSLLAAFSLSVLLDAAPALGAPMAVVQSGHFVKAKRHHKRHHHRHHRRHHRRHVHRHQHQAQANAAAAQHSAAAAR